MTAPTASHWRNSRFQTLYFILGKCHTIDEAYRVALQQHEERHVACAAAGNRWKNWRWYFLSKAEKEQSRQAFDDAVRERDDLAAIIERLRNHPGRKGKDLPDHEAHQACQREEWKYELIHRARTFAVCGGAPQDQLATWMLHPDYESEIYPAWLQALSDAREGKVFMPEPSDAVKFLGGPGVV